MGDFEVETNGRCFLCMDKASSSVKPEPESGPPFKSGVHSLQYFSRYVKLDMSKVFSEGTDVPPDLLAKVAKARLKVELCEGCRSVNESFSKLYRQLERIELEMSSHISLVHRKLAKAKEAITHSTVEYNKTEKFKIAEALREETKQKCMQKLTTASGPNVRIPNWSMKKVNAERRKIQFNYVRQRQKFSIQGGKTVYEKQFGHEASETVKHEIKDEFSSPQFLEDDDTGSNYFDDNDDLEQSPLDSAIPMTSSNINMNEEPEAATGWKASMFERENSSYKCKVCSKLLGSKPHWYRHYKSIHLKIKYKCNLCGTEFNDKDNYKRHHQNIHMGVKFKCLVCHKIFTQKGNLTKHQQRTSSCRTATAPTL